MFGRETRSPVELIVGFPSDEKGQVSYSEAVDEYHHRWRLAHENAREHIGRAAERMKHAYDMRVRSRSFEVGSLVWYFSPRKYVGRSAKWTKNYSGPFVAVEQLSPVNYLIRKSTRADPMVVHVDKLKPYVSPAPKVRPSETEDVSVPRPADVTSDSSEHAGMLKEHLRPEYPRSQRRQTPVTSVPLYVDDSDISDTLVTSRPRRNAKRTARFCNRIDRYEVKFGKGVKEFGPGPHGAVSDGIYHKN